MVGPGNSSQCYGDTVKMCNAPRKRRLSVVQQRHKMCASLASPRVLGASRKVSLLDTARPARCALGGRPHRDRPPFARPFPNQACRLSCSWGPSCWHALLLRPPRHCWPRIRLAQVHADARHTARVSRISLSVWAPRPFAGD